MTDVEKILLKRNADLVNKMGMMVRYMATVQYSPSHEAAVKAANQAFSELERDDPFKTEDVIQSPEEVRKAS